MLSNSPEQAFEDRGLDFEIAAKLGASYQPGKFTFEYRRDGALLFRKIRTTAKEFWIEPKGQRLQFWGLEEVPVLPSRPSEPLVITEGEFDRIAVIQACGGFALSVPNGASGKRSEGEIVIADDNAFCYLWENEKLIPELDQFDKIILATDGDEKGVALRDELALRIGEGRCWFVTYPPGCKDANDTLKKGGVAGVRAMIEGATPMRPGYLIKPSEVPPNRLERTYTTGWSFLDDHLKLIRPELVVVTGEPGHGKGQWIRALCFHMAEQHGMRTAFLTPEDPAHRLKRDMLKFAKRGYCSLMSGQPHWSTTPEQDRTAVEWMDAHFRISTPPEDEPISLDLVEREMESAALHHNCQIFVLDPWNEVEHDWSKGKTETQYIEAAIRRLKRKMRHLGLILIIAAHPTKLPPGQMATLYSINGSANWRNKAEHGIIVYREEESAEEITLKVEKCKDHLTMGQPGEVYMKFNKYRCDYVKVDG